MQKRRVRQMFAAGILLALAAILLSRERLLSNVSTRLTTMEGWVATDSIIGATSEGYTWLSNDELLILRARPLPADSAQVEAFRYNIYSQQETPLADFNRHQASALVSTTLYPVDDTNPYARWGLNNARLSPDRQQLLWLYGKVGHQAWQVARLDGTTVASCQTLDKNPEFAYTCWLPDNRQWVSASATPLSAPSFNSAALLALSFYSTEPGMGVVKKTLDSFEATHPLAFLRDGRLLSTSVPTGGVMAHSTSFPYDGLLLNVGQALWKHDIDPPWHYKQLDSTFYNIFLPGADIVNEIVVSPDETRYALCVRVLASSALPHWLQQFRQWLRLPNPKVWAIYTCRLDGSDWREIGHLPQCPKRLLRRRTALGFTTSSIPLQENSPLPHNLQWSPDGKRLCYCQDNTLYMVSAE